MAIECPKCGCKIIVNSFWHRDHMLDYVEKNIQTPNECIHCHKCKTSDEDLVYAKPQKLVMRI